MSSFVIETLDSLKDQLHRQEVTPKKRRLKMSNHQLLVLTTQFAKDPMPSSSVRDALAKELDMTSRSIQVWFQNRRAKVRTEMRRGSVASSQYSQHSMEEMRRNSMSAHRMNPYSCGVLGRSRSLADVNNPSLESLLMPPSFANQYSNGSHCTSMIPMQSPTTMMPMQSPATMMPSHAIDIPSNMMSSHHHNNMHMSTPHGIDTSIGNDMSSSFNTNYSSSFDLMSPIGSLMSPQTTALMSPPASGQASPPHFFGKDAFADYLIDGAFRVPSSHYNVQMQSHSVPVCHTPPPSFMRNTQSYSQRDIVQRCKSAAPTLMTMNNAQDLNTLEALLNMPPRSANNLISPTSPNTLLAATSF